MNLFFKNQISLLYILSFVLILPSCKDEPSPEPVESVEKVILMYAVASNDLYGNLLDDKNEILSGMESSKNNNTKFVLYSVTPAGKASLEEVVKDKSGAYYFKNVKTYDNITLSTDPERIAIVIQDVLDKYKALRYGLILWSHSESWTPGFSDHGKTSDAKSHQLPGGMEKMDDTMLFWFGADQSSDNTDYTDIDELADAIPSGVFDFIWFDSCFMSSIEVAYQFRDKCRYFVGYPTEIYASGSPYNQTIPYLLKDGDSDLTGAAKVLFDSYNDKNAAVTVAVLDMNYAREMADAAAEVLGKYEVISSFGLMNYGRGNHGPYYDFRQYLNSVAQKIGVSDLSRINHALINFVVYKAASKYNFSYSPIDQDNYSGLSTYRYRNSPTDAKEAYYRTLDWYKDTYIKK